MFLKTRAGSSNCTGSLQFCIVMVLRIVRKGQSITVTPKGKYPISRPIREPIYLFRHFKYQISASKNNYFPVLKASNFKKKINLPKKYITQTEYFISMCSLLSGHFHQRHQAEPELGHAQNGANLLDPVSSGALGSAPAEMRPEREGMNRAIAGSEWFHQKGRGEWYPVCMRELCTVSSTVTNVCLALLHTFVCPFTGPSLFNILT